MRTNKQQGFTLVEIAIVLVIIGLLLGSILKGQELINSARVRNLALQNSGIQEAYYNFIDRYHQVPGDWQQDLATAEIGAAINLPADHNDTEGNGRIDHDIEEATAVWEQLAKAQFLSGDFAPAVATPEDAVTYAINAPANVFNGALFLTQNDGYNLNPSVRLNLHMGQNIPVNIARELDVKVDDGLPNSGLLRLTRDPTTAQAILNTLTDQNLACTTDAANSGADGTEIATDIYMILLVMNKIVVWYSFTKIY